MAILTRTGYNNLLRNIYETGGLTSDMETVFDRLRSDFDEREGILRRYGETYDGEDREDYEFVSTAEAPAITKPNVEDTPEYWRGKYEAEKKRYLDRFFGAPPVEHDTTILSEVEGDAGGQEKLTEKETTYDDLFS